MSRVGDLQVFLRAACFCSGAIEDAGVWSIQRMVDTVHVEQGNPKKDDVGLFLMVESNGPVGMHPIDVDVTGPNEKLSPWVLKARFPAKGITYTAMARLEVPPDFGTYLFDFSFKGAPLTRLHLHVRPPRSALERAGIRPIR